MTKDQSTLQTEILKLNARAWGIAFGLLLSGGLFIATVILVMRGGENPGRHLEMLRVFFPGYSVSFVGALIGSIYTFVIGYGIGRLIGSSYNYLVRSAR